MAVEEIEGIGRRLDEAHREILTGEERRDREAIDRISELSREHGPAEAPHRFVSERQQQIADQRTAAEAKAAKEVAAAAKMTDDEPLDAGA